MTKYTVSVESPYKADHGFVRPQVGDLFFFFFFFFFFDSRLHKPPVVCIIIRSLRVPPILKFQELEIGLEFGHNGYAKRNNLEAQKEMPK